MTNNADGFKDGIRIGNKTLEAVSNFKYLGSIVTDEGSKKEILARIAQAPSALTKLNSIWKTDEHHQ